jgi:hypothetical protein
MSFASQDAALAAVAPSKKFRLLATGDAAKIIWFSGGRSPEASGRFFSICNVFSISTAFSICAAFSARGCVNRYDKRT